MLFDLDGLLVDTEQHHWKAYQQMCARFGHTLSWDFPLYLSIAGSSDHAIQDRLAAEHPGLFLRRTWQEVYQEKSEALLQLMHSLPIPLMPGAEQLIRRFSKEKKTMAVVTHSSKAVVDIVCNTHPVFSKIATWVSREQYRQAKPAPDGYLLACSLCHAAPHEAVGFEDSWRGIQALQAAGCRPILVSSSKNLHSSCQSQGVDVANSLEEFLCSC